MFDVDGASPTGASTVGLIVGNRLTAGPGRALIALSLYDSPVFTVEVHAAQVVAQPLADGALGPGILAGGIPPSEVEGVMLPAIQTGVTADLDRDCTGASPPGCGCAQGSTGAHWIEMFDGNHDCMVTTAEVAQSDWLRTLLAPDVIIDNEDLLSVGVQFTAVKAAFSRP